MAALSWDQTGERIYETGVDHGVLYHLNQAGQYNIGYAWNGLTTVTEAPSGAESNPQYADNIKYLNLISAEEFGATIEAFTYPPEFSVNDGTALPSPGVALGQQGRKVFGFSYRTRVGNDIDGVDHGYKLHLIYGAQAAPSEKAYATINDSPEAINFSWEVTTTPVPVGEIEGVEYKPTAIITIDSTEVDADALSDLEDILYGTAGEDPRLPLPAEVISLFSGSPLVSVSVPNSLSFNQATNTITIPTTTGLDYTVDGEVVAAGPLVITEDTVVSAKLKPGYKWPDGPYDNDWFFDYQP